MEYKIEKIKRDDLKELIMISKRVTLTNSVSFLGDLANKFITSGAIVNEAMANADYTYKCTLGGKAVGQIAFIADRINFIMVDPDFQRKGIGSLLLEFAAKKMFEKYDEIYLDCFGKNHIANSFFIKSGFVLEASTYDKDLKQNLNRYCLKK
ncbi:MAG: GNAT family N-acetyltransferase [Bacilli bacterium]